MSNTIFLDGITLKSTIITFEYRLDHTANSNSYEEEWLRKWKLFL